jgi:hypothetical protein
LIYSYFLDHLRTPIRSTLPSLETLLENAFASGDRWGSLANILTMALTRLYLGQDMAEVEEFCTENAWVIKDWMMNDMRYGIIIHSIL